MKQDLSQEPSDDGLPTDPQQRARLESSSSVADSYALLVWLGKAARRESQLQDDEADGDWLKGFPSVIGRFRLEALLGTGAYGAVFRAYDMHLERHIALKLAWPGVLIDPIACERFTVESKTTAAIRHPGIVEVYDSGDLDMLAFIALELIDGPPLDSWLKQTGLVPPRQAAELIRKTAEAVHYAHDRGVIHRDLKPSNILLRRGESSSGEKLEPVVTDFGLARRLGRLDASIMTQTQAVLGTDHYMSPEQASGRAREVSAASDIFSLGVILYEMLVGRRPFEAESLEEVRQKIQNDEPAPLRTTKQCVPRDLETIVLECLKKNASDRYRDAQTLAEDLQRFLTDRPIIARRITAWERGVKLVRRRPLRLFFGTAGIAALIVIFGLSGALSRQRHSSALEIASARSAAELSEGMEKQHQYAAAIRNAARAQAKGQRDQALLYLKEGDALAIRPVRRGIEWDLLSLLTNDVDHTLKANFGGVRTVRFAPTAATMISGGSDNRIIFWDTATWKPLRAVFNSGRAVKCAEFSADGTLVAIGGENGHVVVHDMANNSVLFDQKLITGRVFEIAWLGNQHILAAGGEDGVLWIVDPASKTVRSSGRLEPSAQALERDPNHPNEIACIAFLAERNLLAVLKSPAEIVLIDPLSFEKVETWGSHFTDVGSICSVQADGKSYLAAATPSELLLCAPSEGRVLSRTRTRQWVEELQYCAATQTIGACCRNGSLHVWHINDLLQGKGDHNHFVAGHGGRALTIGMSHDGRLVASGGRDGTVRVWNANSSGHASDIPLGNQPLSIQFSDCGRWMVLVQWTPENNVEASLFDVVTGQLLWNAKLPSPPESMKDNPTYRPAYPVSFHPQGEELAICVGPGGFETRRCANGEVIRKYGFGSDALHQLRYSGDGSQIIAGTLVHTVVVERATGKVLDELTDGNTIIESFVMDHNVRWLTADSTSTASLRSSPRGAIQRRFGTTGRVRAAALSSDGKYLAVGGHSATINLWDLTQVNKAPLKFEGHDGWVDSLRFTRDIDTLLSLGNDGVFKLWHRPTRSELLSIGSEKEQVLCFAIHPKDQVLSLGIRQNSAYVLRVYEFGRASNAIARINPGTSPKQ